MDYVALGLFLPLVAGGISRQTLTKLMSPSMWKKLRLYMCLHLLLRRYTYWPFGGSYIVILCKDIVMMIMILELIFHFYCQLLVLGGNGFVGSHVCKEALDRGLSVSSLSRYLNFDCRELTHVLDQM